MQRSLLTGEYPAINALDTSPRYIDCYDRAVAILTRRPHLIFRSWFLPYASFPMLARLDKRLIVSAREKKLTDYCHCLFGYATVNRRADMCGGCLTQIRDELFGANLAGNRSLTTAIHNDGRLPSEGRDITVDHLPIFAGWHRRLDIALDRKPLPMRIGG